MNKNSNPEILITIIILSVLLAILSVTTAFCHTERSAGYKNKVNIGKKNHIIIYPIFFVLHMTAILLFNLPFPDLTCYLSFSIGSIAFIFLIQAVIAYFFGDLPFVQKNLKLLRKKISSISAITRFKVNFSQVSKNSLTPGNVGHLSKASGFHLSWWPRNPSFGFLGHH